MRLLVLIFLIFSILFVVHFPMPCSTEALHVTRVFGLLISSEHGFGQLVHLIFQDDKLTIS